MSSLETSIEAACKERVIPGAVLLAADKTGAFQYAKSFGVKSLADETKPLGMDGPMWIASNTKLFTSVAAMQLIERGKITLDDDVSTLLPELAKLEVLTGFDEDDKPRLKKRQNTITLRHLLTHSSGASYDQNHPLLLKWHASRNTKPITSGTIVESYSYPLVFEPGTGFTYGASIDWAGKYIERVTGETLEDYMSKNIWQPLGMKDTTFFPRKRPDLLDRMVGTTIRDPTGSGKVVPYPGKPFFDSFKDCHGGAGLVSSMPDNLKVLQSLLTDDEKLLKKETVAQMFEPQLSKESADALNGLRGDANGMKLFIGTFPPEPRYDWGIGGILTMDDIKGWRNKGTMIWGGMPNLFWSIDPTAGLCILYGSQVAPPGDGPSRELITTFEKAMYERLAAAAKAKI